MEGIESLPVENDNSGTDNNGFITTPPDKFAPDKKFPEQIFRQDQGGEETQEGEIERTPYENLDNVPKEILESVEERVKNRTTEKWKKEDQKKNSIEKRYVCTVATKEEIIAELKELGYLPENYNHQLYLGERKIRRNALKRELQAILEKEQEKTDAQNAEEAEKAYKKQYKKQIKKQKKEEKQRKSKVDAQKKAGTYKKPYL